MKRLLLILAIACSTASFATTLAGASSSDVICTGTIANGLIGKMTVQHDLIIPRGGSCGPTQGSVIGHDVIVEPGGAFFPGGTTIGHDVRANGAALIELGDPNNGTSQTVVRHDVIVSATGGPPTYGNFICQTRIGHDLTITGSKAKAAQWDIGYPDPYNCGRNRQPGDKIGHDATFRNNSTSMEVGSLRVGRNLTFSHNQGSPNLLLSDVIGHACAQSHNRALSASGNRVAHHGHNKCNPTAGGGGRGRRPGR